MEAALAREDKELVVVTQRNSSAEVLLSQSDLYAIGTKAVVKRKVNQEHGGLEGILLGIERSVIIKLEQAHSYLQGRGSTRRDPEGS